MRPLVFLDIDGVLNGHETFPNGYSGMKWECVQRFNRIIAETDCDIVISSAWRYLIFGVAPTSQMTLEGFQSLMLTHGVDCLESLPNGTTRSRVIGRTWADESAMSVRGSQIRQWLRQRGEGRPYVVLDDGGLRDGEWHDMGIDEHLLNVVWTDGKVGLTDADVERAVSMIRGQSVSTPAPPDSFPRED